MPVANLNRVDFSSPYQYVIINYPNSMQLKRSDSSLIAELKSYTHTHTQLLVVDIVRNDDIECGYHL